MNYLRKVGTLFAAVFSLAVVAYKREPVVFKLSLMSLLGSLAIFTPDQLGALEGWIDKVNPMLMLLLAVQLRGNVTPVADPKVSVNVPVKVPELAPAGPSGAF